MPRPLSRCLISALLAACLVGCGPSTDATWTEPLPVPKGARRAATATSVTVAQSAQDRRLAALEEQLQQLTAWELEGRPLPERVTRWRALVEAGEGTDYAAVGRARLGAIDRAVRQEIRSILGHATNHCLNERWEAGTKLFNEALERYGEHPGARELRERMRRLERFRRDCADSFHVRLGGAGQASWMPRSGPVRLAGAQQVGPRNKRWSELVFPAPGVSQNRYVFTLPRKPAQFLLIVRHHVAKAGTPYAPITITVNGKIVAGRFDATMDRRRYSRSAWDITEVVRAGQHDVHFRLEHDALTVYWLNSFWLSEVDYAGLLRVRSGNPTR